MATFKSSEYLSLPEDYSRESRISNIIKMAKTANQRARVLEKQMAKGAYEKSETAYRRYEKAVETFASLHGRDIGRVGQGKKQYENLSDSQLRNIERRLFDFLVAKGSLSSEVKALKSQRVKTLKDRYGIDISTLSSKERTEVFDALNEIKTRSANAARASSQVLSMIVEYKKENLNDNIAGLKRVIEERNPKTLDKKWIRQEVDSRVKARSEPTPKTRQR